MEAADGVLATPPRAIALRRRSVDLELYPNVLHCISKPIALIMNVDDRCFGGGASKVVRHRATSSQRLRLARASRSALSATILDLVLELGPVDSKTGAFRRVIVLSGDNPVGVPGLVLGEPGSAGSTGSFPLSCIMPRAPCLYSTAPGAREVQSILTPIASFLP